MVSSTIDHMVAVMAFLAATLLFIGLFNQTIQTGVIYQRHKALATKASDLLDTILLNPGIPANWGISDKEPTGFGIQDPEFTQYKLSPFSLMRLCSFAGEPVCYLNVTSGEPMFYSNITVGSAAYLLMPYSEVLNYSSALRILGLNGTYGFQLTLTPMIKVSINETNTSPLTFSISASGLGLSFANATVNYLLLKFLLDGDYPRLDDTNSSVTYTDKMGNALVTFDSLHVDDDESVTYCFIAYVHLGGLTGVGYYVRVPINGPTIVPFVNSLASGEVLLAHSDDVPYTGGSSSGYALNYTAIFVPVVKNEFQESKWTVSGTILPGPSYNHKITIPSIGEPGILVVAYNNTVSGGVVLVPWGVGSLGFPVVFGNDPAKQEWVATDTRQVLVSGIAYQVKLALWSLEGYQVVS
ncbi:MAG: hypothetical protein ACPLKZ_03905 [Candidatus Bathyarchaeales archaeon]